jgi:UDP-3-O-[3-hydroxymyristoyl] N-acetylglucosamine deacetylase
MIEFEAVTLRSTLRMAGTGIHSGQRSTVFVHPGSDGLRLHRNGAWINMTPGEVTSTDRCTAVAGVHVVEHLLSALGGAGITDADIEVHGCELPILDGSSAPWFEAFQSIGLQSLDMKRALKIESKVTVADGDAQVRVGAGGGVFQAVYERHPFPGRLEFSYQWDPNTYGVEVGPARTFASIDEVEQMRAAGLGLGGTAENTLVFGPSGYLTPCRFDDEPARHKVLDCMGDLMLCGIPLRFLTAIAERSGHRLHIEAAKALFEATRRLE